MKKKPPMKFKSPTASVKPKAVSEKAVRQFVAGASTAQPAERPVRKSTKKDKRHFTDSEENRLTEHYLVRVSKEDKARIEQARIDSGHRYMNGFLRDVILKRCPPV